MTTTTLERAFRRLKDLADEDESVAEAVEFLVGSPVSDPFARPTRAVLDGARRVNAARLAAARSDVYERSLTTGDVVALIPSISDRKAVDRRRKRNMLLGIRSGRQTLHPRWQFDERAGEVHRGLGEVLAALREIASDPLQIDALATTALADLGGRSIADLLAEGDSGAAVSAARMLGDQS